MPVARAALLLFILTTSAEAGVVCRFKTKYAGDPLRKVSSGTISVSGERYRVELDPDPSNPRAFDVLVSDGTETRLINAGNQTWYREKPQPPVRTTKVRGKVATTQRVEGTDTLDDREAMRHFFRVGYKQTEEFGPNRVGSIVSVTMLLWVAGDLPPIAWRRPFATGFREADEQIARFLTTVGGMPLRVELAYTQTYDGGGTPSTVAVTTFTDFRNEDVTPSRFEVPKHFREQDPVIAVPGVTSRQ